MDGKMTPEQVCDALKQDIRHLIYLDTQFNMRGETDLKLTEMQSLESRGWIAESEENDEYVITEEGERIIAVVLAQPLQAVDVGLVERLRKRAAEERQIAANNARVAELLAPELALFNAREGHNIYATRMAIDHRNSAKRDAAFADDLDAAVVAITRAIGNAQAEAALDWNSESTKPSDDPMNASNGE